MDPVLWLVITDPLLWLVIAIFVVGGLGIWIVWPP